MRQRLFFAMVTSLALVLIGVGWMGLGASAQPTDRVAAGRDGAAPAVCGGLNLVASPDSTPAANYLNGVAAVSTGDVWAVGYTTYGSTDQTLIEHWNGTAWTVVSSPNAPGGPNRLNAVAVVATNDVWATGAYYNGSTQQTLTEHWNGSSWTVVASPNQGTSTNQLNSVAAVATDDVWTVGYAYASVYNHTLVEHWNGTAWSIVASPNPGSQDNYLTGVTALAANDAWAVGYYYDTGTSLYRTLTAHWNGTAWTVVAGANVSGDNNYLAGVSAAATGDVWAVGQHFGSGSNQTLIEHWDGTTWTVVSSPNVGSGDNRLYGVVALAANDAWAGGYGDGNQTLAEHWDGTSWTVVASDNGSGQNEFLSLAAVATTDVWAVGFAGPHTLIEHWNGSSWNIVASPDSTPLANYLNGVAAVSTGDVWAVGYTTYGSTDQTLIEHWNGTAWTVVSSPNAPGGPNRLNAVAVVATNDVWATGAYYNGSTQQTLTEHWDGSSWTVVASPNQGTSTNQLNSVAAVATNDVWTVGYYYATTAIYNRTLIEHWNGTAWSIVASPNPGSQDNYLTGVTALAANDAWAVGYYYDTGTSLYRTLTAHWNGSAWSTVAGANVSGDNNYLAGVSAAATGDVWAVGQHFGSSSNQTLIEHWDGTTWTVVSSPNGGSGDNRLYGVVALAANDAWAGGYDGNNQSLAEHWDGTSWTVVASDNGSGQNEFLSLAAVATNDVWAVGFAGPHTLTEHYTGPCPPPTSTPISTPTATVCPIQFTDVDSSNPFYIYIRCLACRGIVSGYTGSPPCATAPCFLPGANVTRGQTAKFVSNAAGYSDVIPSTQQTFTDVPPSNPFWLYIERAVLHGVISGYSTSPPCTTGTPCFLPGNAVTRGQTAKFVANAAGYGEAIPSTQQTFTDVPASSPFWLYIERAALHGVISGYTSSPPCTTGTPCFLSSNNVTRGQTAKFIANAFYPSCQTPLWR